MQARRAVRVAATFQILLGLALSAAEEVGAAFQYLLNAKSEELGETAWVSFDINEGVAIMDQKEASPKAMEHLQEAYLPKG